MGIVLPAPPPLLILTMTSNVSKPRPITAMAFSCDKFGRALDCFPIDIAHWLRSIQLLFLQFPPFTRPSILVGRHHQPEEAMREGC